MSENLEERKDDHGGFSPKTPVFSQDAKSKINHYLKNLMQIITFKSVEICAQRRGDSIESQDIEKAISILNRTAIKNTLFSVWAGALLGTGLQGGVDSFFQLSKEKLAAYAFIFILGLILLILSLRSK